MNETDKIILWCVAFSISIFLLYASILSIKYRDIFRGCSIMDISEYISEFNESKISMYGEKRKYIRMLFFKLIDLILSPYLFILKLLDFFAYILLWIISWIINIWK